jgi:small subunit ribosomal protein S11
MAKPKLKGKVKEKKKQNLTTDIVVYIVATYSNTHVVITDGKDVLAKGTGGIAGFKGSRKSTPFAGQEAASKALEALKTNNITPTDAIVYVKGPGAARDSATRVLLAAGIKVKAIKDATPDPHNGPRPPKQRRV